MVETFGEEGMVRFQRSDIAMVIEARVTELFERVQREIKMSGYDGLLRAGAVITGGCAQLPGIREVAQDVLGMPVRLARPEAMTGMADILRNPSYSTSVGLLRVGLNMDPMEAVAANGNGKGRGLGGWLGGIFKGLLPDEE
jgi:cell division protein FtsA